VTMYDDLDPQFVPAPGASLPMVARRVRVLRRRRLVAISSVCGVIVVALLASMAFASGGDGTDRVTVATDVTTTTDEAPSTTTASTTTTTSAPVAPPPTESTTTVPKPAHLTVTFDRDRLVIQSGSIETITYTITNDGDWPGELQRGGGCNPATGVWPDAASQTETVLWPVGNGIDCLALEMETIPPHESVTRTLAVAAGAYALGGFVPAPPGDTSLGVGSVVDQGGSPEPTARLPVTITPPASAPLTVNHPTAVTAASGAQLMVDFTITNNLPVQVTFVDQGPCSLYGDEHCRATTPDGKSTGDVRDPPYATAVKPLYLTNFTLKAHETLTVRAEVAATTSLRDAAGGADLPPGIYYFDWDGEKVKFTVTP
jgi:hypothetical protein